MQLVAYGAQDIYLTGNPQITFFKVVYRRHTNFSMEAIEQTFNGTVGAGNRVTSTISRNGDLVHRMYLQQTVTTGANLLANHGHAIIKDVELEIGGQRIDKQSGHWMEVWSQLTEPNPTGNLAADPHITNLVPGNSTLFQRMARAGGVQAASGTNNTTGVFFVPLQFWFCRNPGLALPLIALQYHEVKVILNLGDVSNFLGGNDVKLFADYIYLDTDERRRFAQVSHEYLIEQVQEQTYSGDDSNIDINFNHPVKELIWAEGTLASGIANSVAGGNWHLKLNGHDRFSARDFKYFTRTQVWQHHSGYGGINTADSIGVYSFALKPEEHQPSGTCNFSRIDNAQLITSATRSNDGMLYAVNYNVLRIMSGMGGLAYSN